MSSKSELRSRLGNKRSENRPDVDTAKAARAMLGEQDTFSFSLNTAFRLFLIVNVFSALYRIPTGYDEVYNYWEPTHYLLEGYGRETWEYSLDYKTKSWAFILINSLVGFISKIVVSTKLQTFYLIRMTLAVACSFAEAKFYRTITEEINPHVGRYVFCILFFGAGMFNASTAYLSYSFSMYCVFMAFSHSLKPPSEVDRERTYKVVFWLALASLLGWAMTAFIGIPFAFEEIMVFGRDMMKDKHGRTIRCVKSPSWRLRRAFRLLEAILITSITITVILVLMDQMFYRVYTVVTWNYIRYHVLEHGLSYYIPNFDTTTSSLCFYFWDGFFNFNIAFILALISAGCTVITAFVDRHRVPGSTKLDMIWPYILLGLKLTPFYLWFIFFSLQRHHDASVMYVSYPALALNAAICIFLIRSLAGRFAGMIGVNASARVFVLRYTSMGILMVFSILSVSRIVGILVRYCAPLAVYGSIFSEEQSPDQITNLNYIQESYPDNPSLYTKSVCITDNEAYHFPSQFFLPSDTRLQFIKSKMGRKNKKGLPKTFTEDFATGTYFLDDQKYTYRRRKFSWEGARVSPLGMSLDDQKEDPTIYIKENQCDYLIDTNFPLLEQGENEGYIKNTKNWKVLECFSYLDYEHSHELAREFWIPGSPGLVWGDYCMLKRKKLFG